MDAQVEELTSSTTVTEDCAGVSGGLSSPMRDGDDDENESPSSSHWLDFITLLMALRGPKGVLVVAVSAFDDDAVFFPNLKLLLLNFELLFKPYYI